MSTLEVSFEIVFQDPNAPRLMVRSIRYKHPFSTEYLFEINDQPLDNHSELMAVIKTRKQIRSGELITMVLSGSTLDKYYDRKKETFWFRGRYLVSSQPNDVSKKYDYSNDIKFYIEKPK